MIMNFLSLQCFMRLRIKMTPDVHVMALLSHFMSSGPPVAEFISHFYLDNSALYVNRNPALINN